MPVHQMLTHRMDSSGFARDLELPDFRPAESTETIRATVRREDVDVDESGKTIGLAPDVSDPIEHPTGPVAVDAAVPAEDPSLAPSLLT
jgi:hypothetical protein